MIILYCYITLIYTLSKLSWLNIFYSILLSNCTVVVSGQLEIFCSFGLHDILFSYLMKFASFFFVFVFLDFGFLCEIYVT